MCAAGGGCHSLAVVGSFPEHTGRRRVGTPEEGAYPVPGGTLGYTQGSRPNGEGAGFLPELAIGSRGTEAVCLIGVWGEVGY